MMQSDCDLVFERRVDVSNEKIWRAWTEPELLVQWFAPHPWSAHSPSLDLRPGGRFAVTMRSPDGEDMKCDGVYLVVELFHRLVWTDALLEDFRPSSSPFFTAELTLQETNSETLYRVVAKHKDIETKQQHEKMGFHSGWGQCLDQLVAVMKKR